MNGQYEYMKIVYQEPKKDSKKEEYCLMGKCIVTQIVVCAGERKILATSLIVTTMVVQMALTWSQGYGGGDTLLGTASRSRRHIPIWRRNVVCCGDVEMSQRDLSEVSTTISLCSNHALKSPANSYLSSSVYYKPTLVQSQGVEYPPSSSCLLTFQHVCCWNVPPAVWVEGYCVRTQPRWMGKNIYVNRLNSRVLWRALRHCEWFTSSSNTH